MPEAATAEGKTVYDRIYDFAVQKEKPFSIKEMQETFHLDDNLLRDILNVFTNAHTIEINDNMVVDVYPPEGLVSYSQLEPSDILEDNQFEWKSLKFQVQVIKAENEIVPVYYIQPLKIGNGLRVRLKSIFNNLMKGRAKTKSSHDKEHEVMVEMSKHIAMAAIEKEMKATPEISDRLSDMMIYEFSDVGCLNIYLADQDIEEVVFNGIGAVSLYSAKYGWIKTNVYPKNSDSLFEIATRMARMVQKEINFSNPIVETRLPSGDRVNTLLSNIAPHGTIITVRKFFRTPWTIVGLIKEMRTTNVDIAALLWFGVEYDLNILIAGGSGSGKTTLLNAVCNLIPPSVHVLSIESTREIYIPDSRSWNWLSLISRQEPNAEEIKTTDLMAISLKMRPERIILGEAVKPEDIRSLFQAMQVGHPVYSTIHATSSKELILRAMDPVYGIPKTDINSLDLVVVMYHDIKHKTRNVVEVSEILMEDIGDDTNLIVSTLFHYSPKTKAYAQTGRPKKIFEKVSIKTGMSEDDIAKDIAEKRMILQWAIDNNITKIENFERIVQRYYAERQNLLSQVITGQSKYD